MKIVPIEFKVACGFISKHHRHHKPPQGHKFSIGLSDGEKLIGCAIVGRPVSRIIQRDGTTLEVIRLCTDGTPNACSMLYSACWRVVKELGYTTLITYILNTESGVSLKASGWQLIGECGGGTWHRKDRQRTDKHPLTKKLKFEIKVA
jgi:hypothetical protein